LGEWVCSTIGKASPAPSRKKRVSGTWEVAFLDVKKRVEKTRKAVPRSRIPFLMQKREKLGGSRDSVENNRIRLGEGKALICT